MLSPGLLSQTATLVRRTESGQLDAYGNDVPTEQLEIVSCLIQQTQRVESALGEVPSSTYLAVFPAGTRVASSDILYVDTARFEIDGDPDIKVSMLTGIEDHVEATLKRSGDDVIYS